MATKALWQRLTRLTVPLAVVSAVIATVMPAEAGAALTTGKYCSISVDKGTEACFPTARHMAAYEANEQAFVVLRVYNWNGLNPRGGVRNYTKSGITSCGGNDVDISDANLADATSVYEGTTISLNNSIGSFAPTIGCWVAFWDYNNYAGARLPATPGSYMGYACSNMNDMESCGVSDTDSNNWNNRAGALLVI